MTVYIYPNRLEIWNSGELPDGVTVAKLTTGHISVLRNPDVAHDLYLRGMMEKVGRGCVLIQKACTAHGLPKPAWKSEKNNGVTLTYFAPQVTPQVTRLLGALTGEMSRNELLAVLQLRDRKSFSELCLLLAIKEGLVEMTVPDKPNSRLQRYRLTEKGMGCVV